MRTITLFLFLFSFGYACAQTTIPKYVELKGVSKESFNILKDQENIKHGPYQKEYIKKCTIYGQYNFGNRVGVWKTVNTKMKIIQEFDFTNNTYKGVRIVDSIFSRKCFVLSDDGNYKSNMNLEPPVFIGGDHLMFSIRYPAQARDQNIEGEVVISFVVTKDAELKDFRIENNPNSILAENTLKTFQSIENNFFPGKLNEQFVDVKIQYVIKYSFM